MNKVLSDLAKFSLYLISYLPFPVLYLLSDVFYLILYYGIEYRREVVRTNLKNSFPNKTASELRAIEKKFFKFLADNILESVKMLTISPASIRKRFVLQNEEEIFRHFRQGKSVLACGGHYANWEWGNLAVPLRLSEKVLVVYKPLTDKNFEKIFNSMRSRFGANMVAMKMIGRKIIENKNNTFLAAFVTDQTPPSPDSEYFTTFLNQPTAVFLGLEKLAIRTGHPVIFCHVDRVKRGFYTISFKTLFDNPENTQTHQITETHTRELEKIINSKPELWLWSHKRWKFKPREVNEQIS